MTLKQRQTLFWCASDSQAIVNEVELSAEEWKNEWMNRSAIQSYLWLISTRGCENALDWRSTCHFIPHLASSSRPWKSPCYGFHRIAVRLNVMWSVYGKFDEWWMMMVMMMMVRYFLPQETIGPTESTSGDDGSESVCGNANKVALMALID